MWKRIRIAAVVVLIMTALLIGSQLKAQCPCDGPCKVKLQKYPEQRTIKNPGFGSVINDLECHARRGHPMRNEEDPGNWAHELTHQINSDIRCATKANDNACYVMDGGYFILVEPKVTLSQVAAMVPKSQRGTFYKTYLIEMRRWWNSEPLFLLDETSAYANGVLYHIVAGEKSGDAAYRVKAMKEFVWYTTALVKAVKKHDPKYEQLAELEAVVKWHHRRTAQLLALYTGGPLPDEINPDPLPDYIFSGGDQ